MTALLLQLGSAHSVISAVAVYTEADQVTFGLETLESEAQTRDQLLIHLALPLLHLFLCMHRIACSFGLACSAVPGD